MAKSRLTERRIRDLKANPSKIKFCWDAALPAFGVRVSRHGVKAYVLWTRDGTKKRLLTLGRSPALSLDAARAAAASELTQIERGGAGLTERRAATRDAMTVADGCRWYLETFIPRRQGLGKMSQRTADEYRRQIVAHVVPQLGYRKIADVRREHVEKMLDKIGWATPVQFARVRSLTRSLFNRFEAEGWRIALSNPARFVAIPTERPRERVLGPDEQAAFVAALARIGPSNAALALALLHASGARLNEIRMLKWSYVDIAGKSLILPDTKTGPQVYALSVEGLAILARCRPVHSNPFVFAGRGAAVPVSEKLIRRCFRKVAKMAALEDFRIHDLRRTAIVDAIEAGIPLSMVARMANHSSIVMTARYAKHCRLEVNEAVETLAAARRKRQGADIVAIGERRA